MAAYIVKNCANLASYVLFGSMGAILRPIWVAGNSDQFYVFPYLVMLLSCGFWSLYNIQSGHFSFTSACFVGLAMSVLYLSVFAKFSTPQRRAWIVCLAVMKVFIVASVGLIVFTIKISVNTRTSFVGWCALLSGGLMYAAPMWIMNEVAATRELRLMRLWVCLVGIVNGVLWFIYAIMLKPNDFYISFGNGVGAGFSVYQVAFYVFQYFNIRQREAIEIGHDAAEIRREDETEIGIRREDETEIGHDAAEIRREDETEIGIRHEDETEIGHDAAEIWREDETEIGHDAAEIQREDDETEIGHDDDATEIQREDDETEIGHDDDDAAEI